MQLVATIKEHVRRVVAMFDALERRERVVVLLGMGCLVTMMTLLSVFHAPVLRWLTHTSVQFREVRLNWLILFVLYIVVSFPPMIGYSVLAPFTGMVFGFPGGWPLTAAGTQIGSFLSFMTFRYLLKSRAEALSRRNVKFMAFVETLRQDSFVLLWMIRLCPLPFSLSNAAMSTVPSVEPWKFFAATLLCTPKLFLHVFIGSRLVKLSDEPDNAKWWANLISIILAVTIGVVTSYIIYQRTKEKAASLQAERERSTGNYDDPEPDDFEISGDEHDNPFADA